MKCTHPILKQTTRLIWMLFFVLILNDSSHAQITFIRKENPFIHHIFTADPSARVFNNRLYVYTSHDEDTANYYNMIDWHVFSTENIVGWVDHGAIFKLDEIYWADKWAWAPDCIQRNGRYYFYFPVERTKIGVAVSDSPTGPFTDALGRPLIDNKNKVDEIGPEPIDPAILIDNGQAYLYFGCRQLRVVRLKENMIETEGEVSTIEIRKTEHDPENEGGFYAEAPWIFKRNETYYFVYSNGWGPNSTLVYAMGQNPMGPFEFMGEVMDPVNSCTSHGSMVEFKGKWYIFYHDKSLSNNDFRRSVCVDEITFDSNGKIVKLNLKN